MYYFYMDYVCFFFYFYYTYSAKMMPHQIIENTLCHALWSQMTNVEFLVSPFDPSCLRGNAIDEA